jgi:5'-3' exonuclease
MTLLIVDTDHITHRAAASCEPTKAKPFLQDKDTAIWRCRAMVDNLKRRYNDPDFEFHISGEGNWRYGIYPQYKANRKDTVRPTWLNDVRELMVVEYKATITNDMEVDDICGIRMTQEHNRPEKVVCASLDKDLLQLPGYHYAWEISGTTSTGTTWTKEEKEVFVSPLDGLRRFYCQVIQGDQADNIPAFDGKFRSSVPQFVQNILNPLNEMDKEKDMYDYCAEVYQGDLTTMHRNASVLYIMKDYNDKWTPPNTTE